MTSNKSKWENIQQKINIVIYGTSTPAGRLFDLVLLGVILISVILVMLETVQGFDTKYHTEIIILEWIITFFFTIEYFFRIIALKKPWKYSLLLNIFFEL